MTIHCLTPNPAIDVTYRVGAVDVHEVNRVTAVTRRPGGKGVNVARVLAAAGLPVGVHGFLGGTDGELLRALLADLSPRIDQWWTETDAETRRTIAVVDEVDTTMLNEAGEAVDADAWAALTDTLLARCDAGDVVTVSGSLPPGSGTGVLGDLVRTLKEHDVSVLVDTSGEALLQAASAGADVLKPNRHELLDATGAPDTTTGVARLLAAGAGAVVVSLGADGLALATSPDSLHTARLPQALPGNPTGAGDAVVAALAAALAAEPERSVADRLVRALPTAVAWSAAAVLAPVAGEIDTARAAALIDDVITEERPC